MLAMLLYPLEITSEFSRDLSDFLTARIKSFSPEMIKNSLGNEYEKYEEINKNINNLYEKLDEILASNNRSVLESFDIQMSLAHSMLEVFFYKQGLLDGIKIIREMEQLL